MTSLALPKLRVEKLQAWFGKNQVLRELRFAWFGLPRAMMRSPHAVGRARDDGRTMYAEGSS